MQQYKAIWFDIGFEDLCLGLMYPYQTFGL